MSFATLVLIDEETSNNLVQYVANALGDDAAAFTGMSYATVSSLVNRSYTGWM